VLHGQGVVDRDHRVTADMPRATARLLAAAVALAFVAAPGAAHGASAPWRDRLGLAGVAAPIVAPSSPFLALIDSPVDLTNPAFAGGSLTTDAVIAPYDLHGTATAAVASATGAGGVLGVWPGMRLRSYPFADGMATCEGAARLITRAVVDGAATISMSFGSDAPCFPEFAALQAATRRGVTLVAAAGNGRLEGNVAEYPAAYPHVIAVSALGDGDAPAAFSGTASVPDVAAPGTGVLTAVPAGFDPDPSHDGLAQLTGTSFSAPMVAAAATWLRAGRPRLDAGQVRMALCDGARDVAPRGFDRRTGCGALDLRAALGRPARSPDPAEPNDDVPWVDGVGGGAPARAIWRGGARVGVGAWVARRADPVDVYRILRPPHSRTVVTLTPSAGGADLRALQDTALDVTDRAARLGASSRPGRASDRVTVTNTSPRSRIAYLVVTYDARAGVHRTRYRLTVADAVRSPARPGRRARSRPR
jgi:hypothetical protein